ncbi:hypothetical protein [Lacticaseibacillus parakribbianus]|uniref:hypothetical protein n=1 Tax=Lacticaseibacillus parakribbianus TaxID=2970927 RepID=UPI0021CB72A3|nr:hypothetical protein [Lacticaseibacillus parakribbianus]
MKKSSVIVNGKPIHGLAALPIAGLAIVIAAVVLAVVVPVVLGVSALALGAVLLVLAVVAIGLLVLACVLPFLRLRHATLTFKDGGESKRYVVAIDVRLRDGWAQAKGYYRAARQSLGRADAFAAALERFVTTDLYPVFEQALAAQYGPAVAAAFVAAGQHYQVNTLTAN